MRALLAVAIALAALVAVPAAYEAAPRKPGRIVFVSRARLNALLKAD